MLYRTTMHCGGMLPCNVLDYPLPLIIIRHVNIWYVCTNTITLLFQLLGPPGRVPTHYTIEPECEQENQVSFNCTSQAPRMSGSMVNLSINCDFMHQICNVTIFAMNDAGSTKYTPSLTISKTSHNYCYSALVDCSLHRYIPCSKCTSQLLQIRESN